MEEAADDKLLVNLNVGTLAVIVLVVVTTCSIMTLISLYCWYRSSSHTRIHCARCHQAIGVHGLPLPPQSAPPVPPYGLVHGVPPVEYQFQPPPPTHSSLTSKPVQNHHQPKNLPAIVVNQADHVQCGDSATFQRLGMKRPDSGLANDARALETRALSSVQASPPEVTTPGLEALTPSPVLSGNHQVEGRRGRRVQVAEEPAVRQGVSFQQSGPPSKLQQVRMVNFPSFQTPCAKTPGNALKTKRSSLKGSSHGQRSVSTLQPSQLFLAGHDRRSDQPLLDVSEMCSTAITTGDLRDLCEDTAETSLSHPYEDILTVATVSPGTALTPSPGATLTPAVTITPASHSLRTPAPQSSHNYPSPLTSMGSTLTPNNQYILSQLELLQQAQEPDQFVTDRRTDPSPHLAIAECEDRVNTRKQVISPQIVIAGQDAKVMDRRSLSSPHMAITGHEKNVTDRRSLAGGGTAPLPITSSDMFVTMRKEQHSTSPANVFVFNKNFDPAQPHQETGHGQYQHPLSDLQVGDKNQIMSPGGSLSKSSIYNRKTSYPPSKIPINEGYLTEKGAGSLKKHISDVVTPSGDQQTPKHQVGEVVDRSGSRTVFKLPHTGLDRSGGKISGPHQPVLDHSGGSGNKLHCTTPGQNKGDDSRKKGHCTTPGLNNSGGSGKKVHCTTPGLNKGGVSSTNVQCATPVLEHSVNSSGTRQRSLPPHYPDRPRSERQAAGQTGTYTRVKSPNT